LVSRLEKSEPAPIELIARVLSGKIGIVCLHGAEDAKLLSTGLAKTPRKFRPCTYAAACAPSAPLLEPSIGAGFRNQHMRFVVKVQ
jgi:hypothetical protein